MHTDDPRLTAYVLGELDPPAQAELERLLQEDPEAAREVEALREFTLTLRTQLATETAPALEPQQKQEILSAAEAARDHVATASTPISLAERKAHPTGNWKRVWIPASLAACLAAACVFATLVNRSPLQRAERKVVASHSQPLVEDREPEGVSRLQVQLKEDAPSEPPASPAPLPSLDWDRGVSKHEPALQLPQVSTSDTRMLNSTSDGISAATRPALASRALAPTADAAPATAAPAADDKAVKLSSANAVSDPESLTAGVSTRPSFAGRSASAAAADQDFALAPAPAMGGELRKPMEARRDAPAAAKPMPGGRLGGMGAGLSGVPLAQNQPVDSIAPDPAAAPAKGDPYYRGRGAEKSFAEQPASGPVDTWAQYAAPDAVEDLAKRRDPSLGVRAKSLADEAEIDRSGKNVLGRGFETQQTEPSNTESYDSVTDNAFLPVHGNELSTFSVDVDTASYTNVRRFLTAGQRPPKGAVRIEELINYFSYDYPPAPEGEPFSVNMEVAACPWTPEHRLVRVGLKAREIPAEKRPQANLVFLVDVSGSMEPANKLPLVKESLRLLVDKLAPQDTVGIAVYAGASGTVLEPTNDKEKIREALGRLNAGGSTNGAAGIRLAYDLAKKNFAKEKTNRVILATDGDFNVGTTNQSELVDLITKKAKSGVFLTVLGFGYGNLKDSTMEKLADKGNGNYAYIDSLAEGRKVLVEQMAGTLFTVAKDVKIQVEFNPAQVNAYRLIGYENRILAKEDFNNDKKDAGEVGAGQAVTALYEIVPAGGELRDVTQTDSLRYQPARVLASADKNVPRYPEEKSKESKPALAYQYSRPAATPLGAQPEASGGSSEIIVRQKVKLAKDASAVDPNELLTLKLRWKAPDSDTSTKKEYPLTDSGESWEKSSKDYRWAAAVAGFGMMLRDSPYKGQANWSAIRELAVEGKGEDPSGYRKEFIELLDKVSSRATGVQLSAPR